MAGIALWPKLYGYDVCKEMLAVSFFNIVNPFQPSFVEKLKRFLESGIVNALRNIFLFVGMACCPLRLQVAIFLFNSLKGFEVLECLLYAVAPYDLHPLCAFYILHAFYEIAGHVSPFIQHVLVYGVEDGLGHKLAGLSPLFKEAFLFLIYDFIDEYAETDDCDAYDYGEYFKEQAFFEQVSLVSLDKRGWININANAINVFILRWTPRKSLNILHKSMPTVFLVVRLA